MAAYCLRCHKNTVRIINRKFGRTYFDQDLGKKQLAAKFTYQCRKCGDEWTSPINVDPEIYNPKLDSGPQ